MVKKINDNKNTICIKCKQNLNNCKKIRNCKKHTIRIKNGFIFCKDCGDKNQAFAGLWCHHKIK